MLKNIIQNKFFLICVMVVFLFLLGEQVRHNLTIEKNNQARDQADLRNYVLEIEVERAGIEKYKHFIQ